MMLPVFMLAQPTGQLVTVDLFTNRDAGRVHNCDVGSAVKTFSVGMWRRKSLVEVEKLKISKAYKLKTRLHNT